MSQRLANRAPKQMLAFFSEGKCTIILNTSKIKWIVSSVESKIKEGISVEVDYDGGSYEADIVKMHCKFNYLNVYIYLLCISLKVQMKEFLFVSKKIGHNETIRMIYIIIW